MIDTALMIVAAILMAGAALYQCIEAMTEGRVLFVLVFGALALVFAHVVMEALLGLIFSHP